jgi:hypothetical protein
VYTLLDLPKFDLHALGSKRVYTPRDIVDLTLTIQDSIYPIS